MLQKSIWLLLMVIFISSCKKEKEGQQVPPPPDGPGNNLRGLNEPGFGKSTESFKDPAWALPAGISLASNVHWFGFCNTDSNWVRKKNYIGVPNPMLEYFLVCMEFRNNSSQSINLPLPPIICLQSKYLETQNGFIMTNGNILTIPAQNMYRIFCPVYCVNYDRHAPFDRVDFTNEFTLGPDNLPAPLQEIVSIVAPKNITYEKILKPDGKTVDETKANKLKIIQEAIWQVTDTTGSLRSQTRQQLKDLSL